MRAIYRQGRHRAVQMQLHVPTWDHEDGRTQDDAAGPARQVANGRSFDLLVGIFLRIAHARGSRTHGRSAEPIRRCPRCQHRLRRRRTKSRLQSGYACRERERLVAWASSSFADRANTRRPANNGPECLGAAQLCCRCRKPMRIRCRAHQVTCNQLQWRACSTLSFRAARLRHRSRPPGAILLALPFR